ncbi:MAG: hypothetical protein M3N93_00300 [Acidobacteriota bacterium]|nr:hypothetical protein [Acidobacteriota bacterium]
MKTGAEPKKIAILGGLLVVAAVILYSNVFSGDSGAPPAITVSSVPSPVVAPRTQTAKTERHRASKAGSGAEFKIRQGVEVGEETPDPASIDPTLRLDLLAKLQQVELPASMRNIFQYGSVPPLAAARPVQLPKNPPRIVINPPPPGPAGPPVPPPAPPMTFKYYGYKISKSDGRKEAFLLDGEDIIVVGENDDVKRGRYKVVRIGVNSITIEDTQFKSTQTLPLQEDAAA